jgi:TPR repeat protein
MVSALGNVPKPVGMPQLLDEPRALGKAYDEILRLPKLQSPTGESLEDKARRLRIAAEAGDATAQLGIAYLYANGLGVPKNESEAASWCRKAAEQNSEMAQTYLGEMYDSGSGVSLDPIEAVRWYRRAADKGFPPALLDLGLSLTLGPVRIINYVEALDCFKKAASAGYAPGMYEVGMAFLKGRAVETNDVEALNWFRKAADLGLPKAQGVVAFFCYQKDDDETALKFAEPGAKRGDPNAQSVFAYLLYNGKVVGENKAEAMRLWRIASEQGVDFAAAYYGEYLIWPDNGMETNDVEGLKWLRFATEKGNRKAQNLLGLCYDEGNGGLTVDHQKAHELYLESVASGNGNPAAMYNLARQYAKGWGVKTNDTETFKWYKLAAERGNKESQTMLGSMLIQGQGVTRNVPEALKWWKAAADQGERFAQCSLGTFYLRTTRTNWPEAIKLLQQSAEANTPRALYELSTCYLLGRGLPQNYPEWWKLLCKASDAGELQADMEIAGAYLSASAMDTNHQANAFAKCRQAAENGFAPAQVMLGTIIWRGADGQPPNAQEASKWYRKAAEQGIPEALFRIGLAYLRGEGGVEKDTTEAAHWIERAAEKHYNEAETLLALMLNEGNGVERNPAKSLEWLIRGATDASINGQLILADYYLNHSPPDLVEGMKWLRIASRSGDSKVLAKVHHFEVLLTPEQSAEVEKRVNGFLVRGGMLPQ